MSVSKLINLGYDPRTAFAFKANYKKGSESKCWPWHGRFLKKDMRGILRDHERNCDTTAPRLALELKLGRRLASKKILACHTCDNPNCVNPAHLFEGTAKDNIQDASRKKRLHLQKKTHCKLGHPLLKKNKQGARICGEEECRKLRRARLNEQQNRRRHAARRENLEIGRA